MADKDITTIFGDQIPAPEESARTPVPSKRSGEGDDVGANDEDVPTGRSLGRDSDRPSTADDMTNPRTGPIG